MSPERKTPVKLADDASAAVAQLCRQTMWDDDPGSYQWPADVYATLCAFSSNARGMRQAIEQAARWLYGQLQAGRAGIDADGTGLDAPMTVAELINAQHAATALADVLDTAAQHAAHLTGITPDPADGGGED